ncbi:MAG: thiamine diphosphokinase [Rhodobacteraceae bacterium]|nr:MAG: thiamine diphosphokinase [Paracoccaceae bacterium]
MMVKILQRFDEPITIVGGGEFVPDIFEYSLKLGKELIAVDGGLNYLNPKRHFPLWILGDLDSAIDTESWVKAGSKIKLLPEQNSTDFEKCLYSTEAPLYLANGFLGHRIDHTLASCSTLVSRKDKNIILLGKRDIIIHINKKMRLDLEVGTRLSLFPFKKVCGVQSFGLKYSIEGLDFAPGSVIGTSNEVTEVTVEMNFDDTGMLLILPRESLSKVLESYGVA